MPRLLENASATGSPVTAQAGRHLFIVEGTFGGASVQLQFEGPNGTMIDVPGAVFTANDMVILDIPPGRVQATVTGGTPSGLYADLIRMGANFG